MADKPVLKFNTQIEFANFGRNTMAYLRRVKSDDLLRDYPETDDLVSGELLWALYGADGEPLAVADDKSELFSNAEERDLVTVNLH